LKLDMNLDEAQRKTVAGWIEQGLKLSEIQTKIGKEMGVTMTYMDVRFLIDDLKLQPKDPPPVAPAVIAPAPAAAGSGPAPVAPLAPEPAGVPAGPGGVSVTVDQIARPGAVVSGRVKFSDGQGGAWLIDQMGRPGLVTDQQGYRPSPADIAEFQVQLQNELARMGF
jgi:hypothetical protein